MKVETKMKIINRSNLGLTFLLVISIFSITACAAIPGTLEVSFVPESQAISQIAESEGLRPVLEAILFGGIEERQALVSYTTAACTTADGLGGPPKCEPGQEEGTLVQVLPILSGEGSFGTPESIDQALEFVVMGLYAIYEVPGDVFQADYWPAGEFGLIFTREMNAVPFPMTVFVEDGRIVRITDHFGTQPADLLNQLPVDSVIMDPQAAEAWVAENSPIEPPSTGDEVGTIRGSVCFPGESIPAMRLYFKEINRGDLSYQDQLQDQPSYAIDLAPGAYLVFAYPENTPDLGGSYSQAVACGLGSECTDHSPLVVQLDPGAEVSGVDICDWYSPGDVPPIPAGFENNGQTDSTGSVSGKLCYPSEYIPEMTIFFQDVYSLDFIQATTIENQDSYTQQLPLGEYIVFAYLNSGAPLGGAYTFAVLCGLTADCEDHSLVQIRIEPGMSVTDIDICDWYSPDSIPPDPRSQFTPFASMVYRTREGNYFWVEPNGNSDFIFNGSNLAIPFSGPYGVYADNNELHALDLFSGEGYQLTDTPNLVETSYHFDVGLPEKIVFTAIPQGGEIGPGYTGGLYIIDMDGSNQRTIDDQNNAGNFSTSPDGQWIAYGAGETAYLYSWETGVEVFDPRAYGMDSPKGQVITSPSWSPGGDQLAWYVSGFFDGQATQGFGIFDMLHNTFQLIHPYQSLGMDITPPPAVWSQDGEWLAVSVFDQDPSRSGVWLVNVLNPSQELFMGSATSNPVFGPWDKDRKLLTYFKFDQNLGESKTWIYDLVSGEHQLTPLPPEAQIIAWR
jgi:hypothetical protein